MDPISSLLTQSVNPAQVARTSPAIPADPSKWQNAIETARTGNSSSFAPTEIGKASRDNEPGLATEFIQAVDSKLKAGDDLRGKLLRGDSVNLHEVTIALQEAGTAFSLMVEFRNKMMEGYQELMRMQI